MFKNALLLFAVGLLANFASAQNLTVKGQVTKPLNYSAADIAAMKHVTIKAKGHDEKIHSYSGPLLFDVIKASGQAQGKDLRGKNLAKYLLVKATDGYRAVYALPEIDPEFTDKTIILADKVDGKAISKENGPFQVVVPGEKKHARWVRQVAGFEILTAPAQ